MNNLSFFENHRVELFHIRKTNYYKQIFLLIFWSKDLKMSNIEQENVVFVFIEILWFIGFFF